MKEMDAYGIEVGWCRKRDPLPEQYEDLESALSDANYSLRLSIGQDGGYNIEFGGYNIEFYSTPTETSLIAAISTPGACFLVLILGVPAMFEFLRLYGEALVYGPLRSQESIAIIDTIDLLKEYGPLKPMLQDERNHIQRLKREHGLAK